MDIDIKTENDPVGIELASNDISDFIDAMKKVWDASNTKIPWYKPWKKINFVPVTNFLINCLDELVSYVENIAIPGPDKKATVLAALEKIYDYIIAEGLPIWLKPFAGKIKSFIFGIVLSSSIDWIIGKFKRGTWKPTPKEEIAAKWFALKVNYA